MIMRDLEGLPAAPQTYRPRHKPTGSAQLDSALHELAQQPWVEILSADSGCLMPGDLDEELLQLESEPTLDPKTFAVQSIGLHRYHEAKLTIRLRVLDFRSFQQWIAGLRTPMTFIREVQWTAQMHAAPLPILLFTLAFKYTSPRHVDFVAAAISYSLKDTPL